MLCTKCGARVEGGYKFCPSCGAQLPSSQETPPSSPQTVKKKPVPLWLKILAGLLVIALIGVTAGILFTESLVDVVDHQLEALHKDDINKAYYAYTSKAFQEATSLDDFKEFIKAYPIFLTAKSTHFTQRSLKDNVGILKGNLTTGERTKVPIEYKLIKEDGKWKILGIRLLQTPQQKGSNDSVNAQDLVDIVKAQLQTLEKGNVGEAYDNFASKKFKDATSKEEFEKFVMRYPILTHHSTVSFHKPGIREGVSTLSAILHSDEVSAYLKYYLVQEDDKWKIWSMRILSPTEEKEEAQPSQPSTTSQMQLSDVKLGTEVNAEGIIPVPTTKFKEDVGDIYVNVEIANGIKGETAHLNFKHLDSHTSILAKAAIEESGDTMLMSVFSPPSGGWPKGQYQLVVTSSTGLSKTVDFEIE